MGAPRHRRERGELGVIDEVTDEGVTINPAEDLDTDTLLSLGWDDPDAPQTLPRSVLERTTKADIESYIKVFRLDPDARERSESDDAQYANRSFARGDRP